MSGLFCGQDVIVFMCWFYSNLSCMLKQKDFSVILQGIYLCLGKVNLIFQGRNREHTLTDIVGSDAADSSSTMERESSDLVTKLPIRCLLHPNDRVHNNLPPLFLTLHVSEKSTCMVAYFQMSLAKGIEPPKHCNIL